MRLKLARCSLQGFFTTLTLLFFLPLVLILPHNVSSHHEKSSHLPKVSHPVIPHPPSHTSPVRNDFTKWNAVTIRIDSSPASATLASFTQSLPPNITRKRNPGINEDEDTGGGEVVNFGFPSTSSSWNTRMDVAVLDSVEAKRRRRDVSPQSGVATSPLADTALRSSTEITYPDEDDGKTLSKGDEHKGKGASWLSQFSPGATCRTLVRSSRDLTPLAFQLTTCAQCYKYMPVESALFGDPSRKLNKMVPTSVQNQTVLGLLSNDGVTVVIANVSDPENPLYGTFANPDARSKWVDCCRAAERCCERIAKLPYSLASTPESIGAGENRTCPANWDGWQCWWDTPAGTVGEVACPHYIFFKSEPPSCLTHVPKYCDADGMWRKTNLSGYLQDWTNYTACAGAVVEVQKKRVHVHIMAYAVSIIALTPAIIIFFCYKQLRVQRTILHQNLFISMFINAIFVIAFKTIVILNELEGDRTLINNNGVGCRLLFILTKYLRMTNYMWMFCEGYYLHKLFAAAFAEQKSLIVFYLLGWAFPVIPTGIYAALRMYGANDRCWVVPYETYEWVLNFPSMLSLLINLGFLCNILRVIWTKIKTTHQQYTKALRAVLLLLPLFGLHFVVTIYRPPSSSGCEWIELYYYVNYVLDGLQGWLVALNFCYVNSEVLALIKRTYTVWKEQREMGMQRTQSRTNHRGGGGHTMVSSYYSSVPDSPEPRRLNGSNTLTASVDESKGKGPAGVKSCLTNGKSNNVSTMVLTSIQEDNSNSGAEGWTEITLNVNAPNENSVELKQAFTLSPVNNTGGKTTVTTTTTPTSTTTSSGGKNGTVVEHQL